MALWLNFQVLQNLKKEKEIEPFDVISENSSPKGFVWPNFGLKNKPSTEAKRRRRFVFQTEISGKYIVLVLISRLFYFLSSLRRGDQSTVFCIVSFDFNWSRSPKIRDPSALVCRCGLADIRRFVCQYKYFDSFCLPSPNELESGLKKEKNHRTENQRH